MAKTEAAVALKESMEIDGAATKGRWTTEEIDRLNHLVPPGNPIPTSWVEIANHFPDRSAKQCRERYFQHHVEVRKKGTWTKEEDEIIDRMHDELGNKWSMIATYLKGRTDNDVKNRYWSRERSRKRNMKYLAQEKGERNMESDDPTLSEPSTKKRRKAPEVRPNKYMPHEPSLMVASLPKKNEESLKDKPNRDVGINKPPSLSKFISLPPSSSSSTCKTSSPNETVTKRHTYTFISDTPIHELSLCDAYALYDSKPTSAPLITYRGVTYDEQTCKYEVKSSINGKDCNLGSYALNADAAYTHDVAEKLLRGPSGNLNFESRDDYFKARQSELSLKGGDAEQGVLCSDIDGIVKLVLMKISSEFASNAGDGDDGRSDMPDEVVVPQQNERRELETTSLHSLAAAAASMASDSPIHYPRPDSEAATPMSDSAIKLAPSQTCSLPFPIGCTVLVDPKTTIRGKVTGVQWMVTNGKSSHLYEVTVEPTIISLENNQLAYANGCPIVYSPSGMFDNSRVEDMLFGEIIKCRKIEVDEKMEYSYTIMIESNEDTLRVIKDVPPRQIKYRDLVSEALTSLGNSNTEEHASRETAPSPSTEAIASNSKKSVWPAFRKWLSESETFDTVSEPTDLDVLRGRGGATNGHPGNMKFRDAAIKLCPEYGHVDTSNERKNELMHELVQTVKSYGGRFLEKGKNGQWCVLTDKLARYKAAQALRDLSRSLKSLPGSQEICNKPAPDTSASPDLVTVNKNANDIESDNSQGRREINVKVRSDNELSPGKLLASPGKSYFRGSPPRASLQTLQDPSTTQISHDSEHIKHRAINVRVRANNKIQADDLVAFVADESFFSDPSISDDTSTESHQSFSLEIVSCEEEDEKDVVTMQKSPRRKKSTTKKKKAESASRYASSAVFELASAMVVEPTDLDVLKGRGGLTNHHKGNMRFRDEARKLRSEYRGEDTSRDEKFELSLQLVGIIKNYGGRFLEKGKDGQWHLMSMHAQRKKASQVLREVKWE